MKRTHFIPISIILALILALTALTVSGCKKNPEPTSEPSPVSEKTPDALPTKEPEGSPTQEPTKEPTAIPTETPTEIPTVIPTEVPTKVPDSTMNPVNFWEKYDGTWTEVTEHSLYLDLYFYDDWMETPSIQYGYWNLPGFIPALDIKEVIITGENSYKLMLHSVEADYTDCDEETGSDIDVHVDAYDTTASFAYISENDYEYILVQLEGEEMLKFDRSGNPVYKTDDFYEVINMTKEDAYNAICDINGFALAEKWAEFLVAEESGEFTQVYTDPESGVRMICEYDDSYSLWDLQIILPDEEYETE